MLFMNKIDGKERKRQMDIQKLAMLQMAIETGSLTRTAQQVGFTQSAVSHAIQSLEDELHVRLLHRNRSGVRLTTEGSVLYQYILNIINADRELHNKIAELHKLDYGTVRIGTFTSTAVHWIPVIVDTFRKQYPSISFDIRQGSYSDIEEWIIRGDIDCGFTLLPRKKGLKHILLKEDRLLIIFPPGHPLGELEKVYPSDVAKYPYVSVNEGGYSIINELFESLGIQLNIQYTAVDDYSVIAMVERNIGVNICPELFFYRLPFHVCWRELETDYRRQLCISWKDHYTVSPIVKMFISYVEQFISSFPLPFPDEMLSAGRQVTERF